jgi:hypothetical protein
MKRARMLVLGLGLFALVGVCVGIYTIASPTPAFAGCTTRC